MSTSGLILDQLTRSLQPVHVRFAPKATDVLRGREMTLSADFVAKVGDFSRGAPAAAS